MIGQEFGHEYNPNKWDDLQKLGQTLGCDLFFRERVFKKLIWEKFTGCLSLSPLDSYRRPKICGECNNCVFGSQKPPSWELRSNVPTNNPSPEYPNPLYLALKQETQQILQLEKEEKKQTREKNDKLKFFMWANRIPPFNKSKARSQSYPTMPFKDWMGFIERNGSNENFTCTRKGSDLEGVCTYCPTPENCVKCLSDVLRDNDSSFFVRANARKKSKSFQVPIELIPFIKNLSEDSSDNLEFLRSIGGLLTEGRVLFNKEVVRRSK